MYVVLYQVVKGSHQPSFTSLGLNLQTYYSGPLAIPS